MLPGSVQHAGSWLYSLSKLGTHISQRPPYPYGNLHLGPPICCCLVSMCRSLQYKYILFLLHLNVVEHPAEKGLENIVIGGFLHTHTHTPQGEMQFVWWLFLVGQLEIVQKFFYFVLIVFNICDTVFAW